MKGFPERPEKARPEEMHLYSDEALDDLIAVSLKQAQEKIADLLQSHHPDLHAQVREECMEEHEDRVDGLRQFFTEKRTGFPF